MTPFTVPEPDGVGPVVAVGGASDVGALLILSAWMSARFANVSVSPSNCEMYRTCLSASYATPPILACISGIGSSKGHTPYGITSHGFLRPSLTAVRSFRSYAQIW